MLTFCNPPCWPTFPYPPCKPNFWLCSRPSDDEDGHTTYRHVGRESRCCRPVPGRQTCRTCASTDDWRRSDRRRRLPLSLEVPADNANSASSWIAGTEYYERHPSPIHMAQPSPLLFLYPSLVFCPLPSLTGAQGYHPRKMLELKMLVLEHFRYKHQLNFPPPDFLVPPEDFRDACASSPGVPLAT